MDSAEPKKMTNKNTTSLAEMCTKSPIHLQNNHKGDFKSHTPECHKPNKLKNTGQMVACILLFSWYHWMQASSFVQGTGCDGAQWLLLIWSCFVCICCGLQNPMHCKRFVCPPAQEEGSQPLHRNMLHDDIVDMFLHFLCNLWYHPMST
jgi:hypothetical protein